VNYLKILHYIAFALLVIGGLNWGLVGAFDLNVVDKIFGYETSMSMVVYILVGLSAIFESVTHGTRCRHCNPKMAQTPNTPAM
jgi:uncharacterized protein